MKYRLWQHRVSPVVRVSSRSLAHSLRELKYSLILSLHVSKQLVHNVFTSVAEKLVVIIFEMLVVTRQKPLGTCMSDWLLFFCKKDSKSACIANGTSNWNWNLSNFKMFIPGFR